MARPSNRTFPQLLCLFALVALFASGCMVPRTRYSKDGFYAGASLIGAIPNFDDIGATDLGDSDLTAGLGIRGGYRFLDLFAAEVAYEGFDDFNFDVEDVELQSFLISGKVYLTTGQIQPYGSLGVGILDAEISGTSFDESDPFVRANIGLEAYASPKVPIFVELNYNVPSSDLDELEFTTVQIGAMFRF